MKLLKKLLTGIALAAIATVSPANADSVIEEIK